MIRNKRVHDQGSKGRPLPTPFLPPNQGNDGASYSTWLLVRYNVLDVGDRPLPPGVVFWESPDVWTVGSKGLNQPVVNEATQVFARVSNLGWAPALPVTIKYYWADPAVAIVQDPTKLIGEITGAMIPANSSQIFQCPTDWIPTEVNNGHECIVVEAFVQYFDDLTDPMHPATDRHVGQKNEQLVTLLPGHSFPMHLSAHNFANTKRQIVIEAYPSVIPRNFAQRFGNPEMWRMELLDPMVPLPVAIHVDSKSVRSKSIAGRRLVYPGRTAEMSYLGPPQTRVTQSFRPGEVRNVTVTVTLPPSAKLGEIYVMRIVQRVGEIVVGGYTLYVTCADTNRP